MRAIYAQQTGALQAVVILAVGLVDRAQVSIVSAKQALMIDLGNECGTSHW